MIRYIYVYLLPVYISAVSVINGVWNQLQTIVWYENVTFVPFWGIIICNNAINMAMLFNQTSPNVVYEVIILYVCMINKKINSSAVVDSYINHIG